MEDTSDHSAEQVRAAVARVRQQRRLRRIIVYSAAFAGWIPVAAILWLRLGEPELTGPWSAPLAAAFSIILVSPLAIPAYAAHHAGGYHAALESLASLDDVRVLEALLQARQEMCTPKTREVIDRAALHVLNRVTAADRDVFGVLNMRRLNSLIDVGPCRMAQSPHPFYCIDFTLAAIRALACVGNATSLRHFERFASLRTSRPAIQQVVDLAQDRIGIRRSRLAAEQPTAALLRPATGDSSPFLRPASTAAASNDILVRPVD